MLTLDAAPGGPQAADRSREGVERAAHRVRGLGHGEWVAAGGGQEKRVKTS